MADIKNLGELHSADVLVIGGGLAGTFAAIKAKEAGAENVLLVEKGKTGKSGSSAFAAGVIAAFVPDEDDFNAWFAQVVEQGNYMNDQESLETVLTQIFDRILEMEKWGVAFEKTAEGKFDRRHMRGGVAGTPIKNIMFHGPEMMEVMARRVQESGATIMDRVMVTGLLTSDNQVVGAVGFDARTGEFKIFRAKATVLAAGGTAFKGLFANHKMNTGDASAMLYRAGATLSGFDFPGHHASAAAFDILGMNMFVALGGRFVNAQGERFLPYYDPVLGDHTLQHIYSQAMALEVMAGRGPIYMDMTHFSAQDVAKMRIVLPLITKNLESAGIVKGDKVVRKMEYVSTCFGTIGCRGGAAIDINCQASLPGLFAVGDAAERRASGAVGAGSGALVFAAVSGAIGGRSAAQWAGEASEPRLDSAQIQELKRAALAPLNLREGVEPDQVVLALQEAVLLPEVYIVTHEEHLKKASKTVNELAENEVPLLCAYDPHYLRMAHEAGNMVQTAQLWLTSALERKESRGPLLRRDFPYTDNINWLKRIVVQWERGSMVTKTEEVPLDRYRLKPKREKYLHPTWKAAESRGIKVAGSGESPDPRKG